MTKKIANDIYGCPLEVRIETFLNNRSIKFTRPERDPDDPTNLDFYLPAEKIYLEVKQFHTYRIAAQTALVERPRGCIVLIGDAAVSAFIRFAEETKVSMEKIGDANRS